MTPFLINSAETEGTGKLNFAARSRTMMVAGILIVVSGIEGVASILKVSLLVNGAPNLTASRWYDRRSLCSQSMPVDSLGTPEWRNGRSGRRWLETKLCAK